MFSYDIDHEVEINLGDIALKGFLHIPKGATGIVLFAHGSGSGRLSPRNQFVAKELNKKRIATLLLDLLTPEEEQIDAETRELRFDIYLLAVRLVDATDWLQKLEETKSLKVGYFGASTGAAAALLAAVQKEAIVKAVVSRGGRPDLAGAALQKVKAPTLLIVGGDDFGVIELNEEALRKLTCHKKLQIIPHATHLFEEPGTLEQVARLATQWFSQYLKLN